MSIQQSINSALSTIGIVSGLYQNTPSYQRKEQEQALNKKIAENQSKIDYIQSANFGKDVTEEGVATDDKYSTEYKNQRLTELQQERAELLKAGGYYEEAEKELASLYAHNREIEDKRARLAKEAEAAMQDKTERRNVANQYMAILEQRANDPTYGIVMPDSATGIYLKGGNK